jgi:hypothetical protein
MVAGFEELSNPRLWEAEVFISHIGVDKDSGLRIYDAVKDLLGLRPLLDVYSPKGTMNNDTIMGIAAARAPIGVAILSPAFFETEWPLQGLALNAKAERIVPVWTGGPMELVKKLLENKPAESELTDEDWGKLVKDLTRKTIIEKGGVYRQEMVDKVCYSVVKQSVNLCERFGRFETKHSSELQRFRGRVLF